MLQHFINSAAVGFYDVAVRLTELLGFIPGMIIGSLFPAIINAKKTDSVQYRKRLRSLSVLCLVISATLASILYLIAPVIVNFLFGDAFAESVTILRIYVWSNLGTVALLLISNYLIIEEKSHFYLLYTIVGAITNIFLNMLFIPLYGTTGAAYATLITLMILGLLFIATRHLLISKHS